MPAHKKYFTIEEKKRADSKRHVYKKTSFTIESIKQNIKREFKKQDDRMNLIAEIWFVFDVLEKKKQNQAKENEKSSCI